MFLVCHIYALIWSFTHIMMALGIYLIASQSWMGLTVYATFLSLAAQVHIPRIQTISNIFIPALEELFGGCQILRCDLAGGKGAIRPRIYAVHPHGITANGLGLAMHDCILRGEQVTVAVSSWLCIFNPLLKWFLNAIGMSVTSVRASDIRIAMARKQNIAILPGGFEELMLMEDGADVVYVKHRKGFINLAIRHGYDIVPVFLFGESKLFRNRIPLPSIVKQLSARWRFPLVFPRGASCWNFVPYRPPQGLRLVFGSPISTFTDQNVTRIHSEYIKRLRFIYRHYNPYKDTKLIIL